MRNSLFVAGLDYAITSEELKSIFSEFGVVSSAKVISDKLTGRSKGFGFVDMATQEEAELCIKQLNNAMVKNRTLVVKEKKDEKDKPRTNSFRSNGPRKAW